ncbi:MAG: Crp/Fnr family transcriptional regulator [Anaerolineales bacterium]|nr:Crp/Fnr family transcriptional regulator [Anaerolineales bacterium]
MPTAPAYLKDFFCFRDFSDAQREAIAQLTTAVCYPPGYVLFEEGKPGERIYLLSSGQIEVLYNIGEGAPTRVDQVSAKEIIGCCTLVPPYVNTSTARSLTDIEVLEIEADALRNLMHEDCPLGFAIQQEVIRLLQDRVMNFRLG